MKVKPMKAYGSLAVGLAIVLGARPSSGRPAAEGPAWPLSGLVLR